MQQNRLKSPVVWLAVTAQVVAILLTIGVIDAGQGDTINQVVAGLMQLLIIFGVLNNPTDQGSF